MHAITTQEPSSVTTYEADSIMSVISRSASDPSVDVGKLDRLLSMYERINAKNAEVAFSAAMSAAQSELRQVATDASNPQTRSRYATYAAIDAALRPVYSRHGFAISFNTGDAPEGYVRVLCDVSHSAGHCKQYRIDIPSDGKGAKGGSVMTGTHAVGAGTSYGMRYLLKMIFNVAVGEYDLDGNDPVQRPEVPAELLQAAREKALQGTAVYQAYFSMLTKDQRKALAPEHESLKAAAIAADKGAA
ncbi:MAG: ERF superfamily protein [Chloroflexi bacterium OLB13]|nr:MAG: ERF superfamily protein [Chloroflexi bacterium OLB13]